MKDRTYDPLRIDGVYGVLRGIIGFLFHLLARVEVQGLENLPKHGPFIVVPNHIHWLDSPLIMAVLPYRANVFAGEKWEKHWAIGPLMRAVNAIFVNRGEVDRKALREALARLENGAMLGVAPEGTRSKTGGLQRPRNGAAYLAYHSGAQLVPLVSWGQERLMWSVRHLRRARVRVVIGPPFDPPTFEGKVTMGQLDAFTEDIMYRLAAMLPPKYRGLYADVDTRRPDLVAAEATKQ